MQNSIPNLKQSFIISDKQGYLSEKLITLSSSNQHKVQYILLNFAHVFYLTMSRKEYSRFLLFCLYPELLIKI